MPAPIVLFSDFQKARPSFLSSTNGQTYNNVIWLPLNQITINTEEIVRSDNELTDDAMNYAALMESGKIFPPMLVYPDKSVRDGRTRHQAYRLISPSPTPDDYLVPCIEVPKPEKLGVRLLDAFCDNASFGPRKMTRDALRDVIRRCLENKMYQRDIKKHLEHSDFGKDVIDKIIIELQTNMNRTKREAVLTDVRKGIITPVAASRILGIDWTPERVEIAAKGGIVGAPGNEESKTIQKLQATFQPLAASLGHQLASLRKSVKQAKLTPARYEEVYADIGKYITNIQQAYQRGRRGIEDL